MLLSEADMKLLEKAGYDRVKFARFDKRGYVRLRNHRSHCFFYDIERHQCRAYRLRPLGCRIYPVIYSEEEGVIVDALCPMKETVTKDERENKGRKVVKLLKRIDDEAKCRIEAAHS